MIQPLSRYLQVGDRLLQRGKFQRAAAVYGRYADTCVAEECMNRARACVDQDPLAALKALAQAERIMGASRDGRILSARAYSNLGHYEIAQSFRSAGQS